MGLRAIASMGVWWCVLPSWGVATRKLPRLGGVCSTHTKKRKKHPYAPIVGKEYAPKRRKMNVRSVTRIIAYAQPACCASFSAK